MNRATPKIPSLAACLLLVSAFPVFLHADTRLPAIFGDHMILQRRETTPVWGTAPPGKEIVVEFAGQSRKTRADSDGRWQILLKAGAGKEELAAAEASPESGAPAGLTLWLCAK